MPGLLPFVVGAPGLACGFVSAGHATWNSMRSPAPHMGAIPARWAKLHDCERPAKWREALDEEDCKTWRLYNCQNNPDAEECELVYDVLSHDPHGACSNTLNAARDDHQP